jgi:hypothetical protein
MNTLTTIENVTLVQDALAKVFPYVNVSRQRLGGDERATLYINVSKQPKDAWTNKIFQNSDFAMFSLQADGTLERFCGYNTPKLRKSKVKDIQHMIDKLTEWNQSA